MENEKRLIYADFLLKKIQDTAEGLADCDQQNAAWALRKYAVRDIMDAETVDAVEVVHGRWLTWEEKFPGVKPRRSNNLGVFCDKCHNHADNRTYFCPNCGANMKGE